MREVSKKREFILNFGIQPKSNIKFSVYSLALSKIAIKFILSLKKNRILSDMCIDTISLAMGKIALPGL